MISNPLFSSDRLHFRTWKDSDLDKFSALNSDPDVMEHFPSVLSAAESKDFLDRLQKHQAKYGHCYFAVETKDRLEFIGFIGLAHQVYDTDFTPATDIGWRLKKSAWGNGYATEGALRCLDFGFENLGLEKIIATCTLSNKNSEKVMQKIGMEKIKEFDHPRLKEFPDYERCLLYEIKNPNL